MMSEDNHSDDDIDWYDCVKNGGLEVRRDEGGVGDEDAKQIAKALMHPDTIVQELYLMGVRSDDDDCKHIGDEGATAIANALNHNSKLQVLWKLISTSE